jgi:hypothetical protein
MADYVYETREVVLPIGGQNVKIKEGDGYATRILLKRNKKMFEIISDYLASFVVSIGSLKKVTPAHILDLFVPDQDFLSVECYKLNYGDTFIFNEMCLACGTESEHSFPLADMKFVKPKVEDSRDPSVIVILPKTKKKIKLGLLTGHKEALVMSQIETGIDINQSEFQSIREFDGSTDFSYEDVLHLPLADHRALGKARKDLFCGFDANVKITCPSCSTPSVINVLVHRDFLFPIG